ncbi:FkbM family methyltransferase [Roseimicrobium gellanilyticum]|uniref:FkbM family methyltransferase n=1 Tax=Roseimicrobium gellanilyticum TaxID=748857 RepID=A0A366HX30_9BACT|nr:FkbM family methyltransferase [Roseimicrobium gellanilyticum]RBP48124.1 FkbM family methyltransferase [Roseimicrobium gellanilyticum]
MQRIKDHIAHLRLRAKGYFPYFGAKIFSPPNSILFQRVRREGVFERVVSQRMQHLARPDTWFFDVGANLGLMSVPVLANNPRVKAVSIEPSPNSFPYLSKTREASAFRDRWNVVSKAVSNTKGVVDFVLADSGNSAFEGMKNTGRVDMTRTISVETIPLDDIWVEFGRPEVSLIKIDVEGAECLVLQGAEALLKQCRPMIILEWTPANLGAYGLAVEDLLTFATERGYRLFDLENILPIPDAAHLRLLCQVRQENFLLVPLDRAL